MPSLPNSSPHCHRYLAPKVIFTRLSRRSAEHLLSFDNSYSCGRIFSSRFFKDDFGCHRCVSVPGVLQVQLTLEVQRRWEAGEVEAVGCWMPPDQPPRAADLAVLEPGRIKRGKGGTLGSRIALLHSLANIEQWAIDLSWDIIARFSDVRTADETPLPRQFFSDFVKVAGDEAKHFKLLETRIRALGSHFGALPVHNGLWQSARETSRDLRARLAVVHMVHEARGLDVHPQTRARFAAQGDSESVLVLDTLYEDEVTHVAAGLRWFTYLCKAASEGCVPTFHQLVRSHFHGYLKPPFDTQGRNTAGMGTEWYLPLVKPAS